MRIALVHDYLNQMGGAENVLLTLHEIFPQAPIIHLLLPAGSHARGVSLSRYPYDLPAKARTAYPAILDTRCCSRFTLPPSSGSTFANMTLS